MAKTPNLKTYTQTAIKKHLELLKVYQPSDAILQESLTRVVYATIVGNYYIDLRDFRIAWSYILNNTNFVEKVSQLGIPESTESGPQNP